MPHLHRTLVLCLWCSLLLHRQVAADEEAGWGPTPARENPPQKKASWFWPSLPKLPSLPSLSIPFYGSSNGNDKAEGSASGELNTSDASEAPERPTASTQQLLTSVTQIRTESPPTGTSDSPRSSKAQRDNDSLVSNSYSHTSRSITNTLSTISTFAPEHNATRTRPPWGPATPGTAVTARHLPGEDEAGDSTDKISSGIAPETRVPTALTRAAAPTATAQRPFLERGTPSASLGTTDPPVSITPHPAEDTLTENHSTRNETDSGLTEEPSGEPTPTMENHHRLGLEFTTSTTQSQRVNVPIAGELEAEEGASPSAADGSTPAPTSPQHSTEAPRFPLFTVDWTSNLVDSDVTFLPDCNRERGGICNVSDAPPTTAPSRVQPTANTTAANHSINPLLVPAPPMLVPLYTDWNSAMASWGLAWEAHVYGAGCAFAMLTLASALNLLCLPLRCPSGCGYFALVSLFLLAAGGTRAFSLLYDAYGHQDRLPSAEASLVLYEAPFPCFTAAFGLVFLLLSMRSRMQLSYSAFQRPCFLACLVVLHFAAAFGPVTLLKFYQQKPPLCLFLSLISRGAFVALAMFLSAAYFVFYVYVRADSKHIYHLNNTSPTPAERYNRCPFAESRDWDRAAATVCLSALFSLACAGLQLYAMLNAMGVAGGEEVFHPWPWWAFQFSCRLCELGVCLTLALVVAQPVYCSDHLPAAGNCWTELLASKSPILPGNYQWTLSHHEKLAIVDTVGLGETESLPLYTLMDERLGSSLNGLDLLYHSNRALAYRDLDLDMDLQGSEKPEVGGEEPSGGSSSTSDSTADLRPPSPINLRRSIDEALFSEAIFSLSLFSPARPLHGSDQSINKQRTLPSNGFAGPISTDTGLYRTSSCLEMASKTQHPTAQTQDKAIARSQTSSSSCSSPERWRDSSSSCSLYRASTGVSSLVLCPSPERNARLHQQGNSSYVDPTDCPALADPQRRYQTLGGASQESLDLDGSSEADRSVQEEFISVCRQIDALSICSETIDL
ncbi:proline-rich transmembrane protein 4 [Betta splendens]|uniref:Proline-rich transmembrane protein 4 n=1 Tax=Betta splendens TaxID=158456 RepID=A0A6P7NK87_BETSP|nr:proline-rich transmembrane protein 4 [Betta splendens]